MAPIVTGDINVDALDDLVRLCVELDPRRRGGTRDAARDPQRGHPAGPALPVGRRLLPLNTPTARTRCPIVYAIERGLLDAAAFGEHVGG